MSTMTLFDPPRHVRCQNPVEGMRLGSVYIADAVLTHADGSRELRLLDGRWYAANRFYGDLDITDCEYEERTLGAATMAHDEATNTLFDFDRYNSLAALPGGRR